MALIDDLLARLIQPLFDLLNRWLAPLRRIWDKIIQAKDHLLNVGSATQHLFDSITSEVQAWRTFKENPRWRSRVINAPIAFEKTQELIQGIPDSWRAIVDLFRELRGKVDAVGEPEAEAREFAADLESGEGVSGLLRRLPRLARGLERLFGFLAIAVDALETIANAIGDLQTIVDEASRIRREIEELDTIFLSQKNPRKTVRTADGGSLKIRLGNLHEA